MERGGAASVIVSTRDNGIMSNPYEREGSYWWDDKNGGRHGPHKSETAALLSMLVHMSEEVEWRRQKAKLKTSSNDA